MVKPRSARIRQRRCRFMSWRTALVALSLVAAALIASGCATVDSGAPAAATPSVTKDLPSKPAFRAAEIEGKTADDLDALLGAPQLLRVEGAGEFRRYMLADCALLVILYPDEKGIKRAAEIDAGALRSGDEKPDLDLCLARGKVKES
jgi:hypothetical protein